MQIPTSGQQRAVLLSAVIGGVAVVAGQALQPLGSDASDARLLASMAQHHDRWVAATLLLFAASLLITGATTGLLILRWPHLGVLGRSGAAILAAALATTIALDTFQAVQISLAADVSHRGLLAVASNRFTSTAIADVMFVVFLAGLVLGTLLLAGSCWRRRLLPRWTCIGLGASGFADLLAGNVAEESAALALLVIGLTLLAAAPYPE